MDFKIIDNIHDYIDEILTLDDDFYDTEYLWTNEYQEQVYNRNKDSFIAVKLDDKLIGYLNYLCIKEDVYNKIKTSNTTIDDFKLDEIIEFKQGNNYITINSVVIKKEYQETDVIKIITDGFLAKLKELTSKGINITGIDGIAVSNDGRKFFKDLGFTSSKDLSDGNTLFYMDDDIVNTINNAIDKLKNK